MSLQKACEIYSKHLAPLLIAAQERNEKQVRLSAHENPDVFIAVGRIYTSFEFLMRTEAMNSITMEKNEKDECIIFTLPSLE